MFFSAESEVIGLAAAFYRGELRHSQWDKAAQMAVTLYFGLRFPSKMALELLSDRVRKMGLGRYGPPESRAILEEKIHSWLQIARDFEIKYGNIEDLAALANIFIATHWKSDEPYPHGFEKIDLEADTGRLASLSQTFIDLGDITEAIGMLN
jgi:hypothetical protein